MQFILTDWKTEFKECTCEIGSVKMDRQGETRL